MNILHIITGLNDGGAEGVLYRLCTHDPSDQHTIISIMDEGKYGPLLQKNGFIVHCLGMPQGRVIPGGLFRLWGLVRRLRPEVVQTWMYHADLLGGLVARLAGVRHVCWGIRHTTLQPGSSKQSTIMVTKLCAKLSRWVPRRIVYCALKAAEVHQAVGYAADKCVVIPNGYDLTHFAADQASGRRVRDEWGVAPSVPLLGMVGRFDPQKDHGNLLQALGLLKHQGVEFRCALVGNGLVSANDELGGWLRRYDVLDRVLLVGRRNDIPAVMNALDLHILSSAYGEAFPNVLAEAMACGTPCVTTDVGDASVIIGDTGWVVPPRNPQALAKAIEQAFKVRRESTAWQERRHAARERVADKFSIERMVSAYHQVWQDAVIGRES